MEAPAIDGYSGLVRVAKGGFGVVYRARQDRFDRVVALKVLNVEDVDDRSRKKFERECRAMGSLGWHPNVVAVFDSGIGGDGRPWLAMEYLDESLGERVRRGGPLGWREVLRIGVQVAGALGAAHATGVLHRDLKPDNLLFGPFGEVKLSDFGIAAIDGVTRSTTGHLSFTIDHVAPEVLRRRRPDERSDLYSLGSTLHTLIAGRPPFAGESGEPDVAIIASVLHDAAPRVSGVPEDLADVIQACLAKDPDMRPSDAEEFGRLLQLIQSDNNLAVTDLRLTRAKPHPAAPHQTAPEEVFAGPSNNGEKALGVKDAPPEGDPRPTVLDAPQCDPSDPRSVDKRSVETVAPSNNKTEPGADPRPTLAIDAPARPRGDPRPTVTAAQSEEPRPRTRTDAAEPGDDAEEAALQGRKKAPQKAAAGSRQGSDQETSSPEYAPAELPEPSSRARKYRKIVIAAAIVITVPVGLVLGMNRNDSGAARDQAAESAPASTTADVATTTTLDPAAVAEYAQAVEDARILDEYLAAVKANEDTINYAAAVAQAAADAQAAAEAQAAADARAASAITSEFDCPLGADGTACRRSFVPEGPGIYYP